MTSGELSVERAFGGLWKTNEDIFGFKIAAQKKPLARYKLLLTLGSVYNLLGLAVPFILEGCIIIHILCKENSAWDEPIPRRSKNDYLGGKAEESKKIKAGQCFKKSNDLKNSRMQVFSIFQMHQTPDMNK